MEKWRRRYGRATGLTQEIDEAITDRNRRNEEGRTTTAESEDISRKQEQLDGVLDKLQSMLGKMEAHPERHPGVDTARMKAQLEGMQQEAARLRSYASEGSNGGPERRSSTNPLLGAQASGASYGAAGGRAGGGAAVLTTQQRLAMQERQMQEQDGMLEVMADDLGRLRQTGHRMGDELQDQDKVIRDLDREVSAGNEALDTQTGRIDKLLRESGVCWMYIVILILFVLFLVFLPAAVRRH